MNKLWAIIPAAGAGQRFENNLPKQYHSILNQSVLLHSIQSLFSALPIYKLYIAHDAHDELIHTHINQLDTSTQQHIELVHGGAERAYSVLAALKQMQQDGIAANDWVLVHDAARPCVRQTVLSQLWQIVVNTNIGGILAAPVRDTLKYVDDSFQIRHTVDRNHLWQAQTPQLFSFAVLYQSLSDCLQQGVVVTDEASALEYFNHAVQIVPSPADNIKITYPEDLQLAQQILLARQVELDATNTT